MDITNSIPKAKSVNDFPFPHHNLGTMENYGELECAVDPNDAFVRTAYPIFRSEKMGLYAL